MNCEEEFLLKWNNHQNNLVGVFKEWLRDESFVDVTLVCDGEAVPGHKMILAACSPLLNRIFHDNPCRHPVLILNDVPYSDMKALMNFIYQGEVSVSQSELQSFLRTADNLQIKGLAEEREKDMWKRNDKGPDLLSCNNRKRPRRDYNVHASSQSVHILSKRRVTSSPLNHKENHSSYEKSPINSISSLPSTDEPSMLKEHLNNTSRSNQLPIRLNQGDGLVVKTEPLDFHGEMVWQEGSSAFNKEFLTQEQLALVLSSTTTGSNSVSSSAVNITSNSIDEMSTKYASSPLRDLEGDDNREEDFKGMVPISEDSSQSNSLSIVCGDVEKEEEEDPMRSDQGLTVDSYLDLQLNVEKPIVSNVSSKCDAISADAPDDSALSSLHESIGAHSSYFYNLNSTTYSCDNCAFQTQNPYTYGRHLKIHIGSKDFKCSLCSYASTRKDSLRRHFRLRHLPFHG